VGWAPHQIEEKKKSVGGQRRMSGGAAAPITNKTHALPMKSIISQIKDFFNY